MAKAEWGSKRKCLKCGTFFYDMNKKSFACPKCKEKYTPESYEESKSKQLLKLAKKAAPRIDDENLDEEALLKMTEDVPLTDEEIETDELEILDEDADLSDTEDSDLSGMVGRYNPDEENTER